MGGSSGGGSSTQTQKLDPWLKGEIEQNLSNIRGLEGYSPYPADQAIAPLTPEMQQAMGQMGQLGQLGFGAVGQGLQGLQNVAGYSPQQISGAQVTPNIQAQSVQAGQVNPTTVSAQQVSPASVSAGQANLSPFSNPYEQQVVDQTLSDIDRSRQMAVNQTQDQAISRNAFGGSRSALLEAETNRGYADAAARAAGQLRQQGYNTALGAAQNQQGMDLQAGGMNQQADLQGQLANQQTGLQAGLANQSNNMQGQLANMQAGLQAAGMNQSADLQSQLANLEGQQFNAQNLMNAQLANQSAGLDAARLNLLGSQGLLGSGQGLFGQGLQAAQMGQNYEQAIRDFDFQQYQQAFQDPRILAQMETAAIQGIPMFGTTSSSQPGGSSFGSAIGGGLSGAAMGAQFGGAPGAAIGGGLGLLGGMFG